MRDRKQNQSVIRMLARMYRKENLWRNRILKVAVCLCIFTLTLVFGVSYGKAKAEYLKEVRQEGMVSSVMIENVSANQYQKVKCLSYIKEVGRRVRIGNLELSGGVCDIQVLDQKAWNQMVSPAYTGIQGEYPKKKQEVMLSKATLQKLGITKPEKNMRIPLTVTIGLFRTEEEVFTLSGWYTEYIAGKEEGKPGYISQEKAEEWGYHLEKNSDILICPSDNLRWEETEQKLYQDLTKGEQNLKITAKDSISYRVVSQFIGSYELMCIAGLVILIGICFLVYNVVQISMMKDVRQMGLLNTIGATKRQICKIYYRQIGDCLIVGSIAGVTVSMILLLFVLPQMLGQRYLREFGGANEFQIFHWKILMCAVVFTGALTLGASYVVIIRVVKKSCIESANYTIPISKKRSSVQKKICYKRRSSERELWYMAYQNLTRNRIRFWVTVCSLFLGVEAFLGVVVITRGSDYENVIQERPDFFIAGEFSKYGQEQEYGNEYKTRDAGEDPLETKGNGMMLLAGNEYEEFSPISPNVREQLLAIPGINQKKCYVMEGAYVYSKMSRKGYGSLNMKYEPRRKKIKEGVGYSDEYEMMEGTSEDVIQILSQEELEAIQEYTKQNHIPIDMERLKNGTGVVILHDHQIPQGNEKFIEEGIGEPVSFTSLWTKEEWRKWNQADEAEKAEMEKEGFPPKRESETFRICGYLDNQKEGFPKIRQTWHGAEGMIYYLISEEGFRKIPTSKKTLSMELNVEESQERMAYEKIQTILQEENRKRSQMIGTDGEENIGEAGIFCISKSDILRDSKNYIRGNRLIFGSISIVLLMAGVANYINVMVTGILARKTEFTVMEKLGMTKKQKKKLIVIEGVYYLLAVLLLVLTIGLGLLKLLCIYMQGELSYFRF